MVDRDEIKYARSGDVAIAYAAHGDAPRDLVLVHGFAGSIEVERENAPGATPVAHHAGDQYAAWPPDFYMSRVKRLAADATPARFRSLVASLAARVAQQENVNDCTGG